MSKLLTVKDQGDGKLISLSPPLLSRARFLNFFYAFMFLCSTAGFAFLATNWGSSIVAGIIASLMAVAFAIGFYRFINKATEQEALLVTRENLDIIVSALLKSETRSFLVKEIGGFRFLEKEQYSPHPLKGETFDYLGFQTEQQVIQDLHSEGRAAFDYRGRQVRFGKSLASWDFNELEVLLYDITGNDFRYTDEYEKENFPAKQPDTND